jgi:hypothetical protein
MTPPDPPIQLRCKSKVGWKQHAAPRLGCRRNLMKNSKQLIIYFAITLVFVLIIGVTAKRSSRLERALGVKLPDGVKVVDVHIEKVPDYPVVSGYAKISMDGHTWPILIERLRLLTNGAPLLPYSNLPASITSWWQVPNAAQQLNRAAREDNGRQLNAVFSDGIVYIEFSGNTPVVHW